MDPEGVGMSAEPILQARGLVKRYGHVTALDGADFNLYPGEILGKVVNFRTPLEAREAGIETVYQDLALSPALSIADNMFLGREIRLSDARGRFFRTLDRSTMQRIAREKLSELGLMTRRYRAAKDRASRSHVRRLSAAESSSWTSRRRRSA